MNSNINMASIDKLYKEVKKGINTDMELFALKVVDKTADALSSLPFTMLFVIVVAMFTFNMGLSFFIVSGFYLILALILYMFKDSFVKMSVDNFIIAKSLKSQVRILTFRTY